MKKEKVTVIIPTFNRADIISRAINSVLKQSYKNWELIIIDDGSIDDTKEIVKPLLKDKRIKYFFQKHKGVCAARNLGIRKAKGNYIAFLDSDDEFWKEKIEIQLREIKKYRANMLLCNFFEYRENKKIRNRFKFNESFLVKQKVVVSWRIPMSASLMFLTKKLVGQVLFDEKMPSSNDFDFILRALSTKTKIIFLNYRLTNNYKSTKRNRISIDFESKIKGYQLILKKIESNKYQLNTFDKKTLLKKTYQNLASFYFLSKHYKKGREFCDKIIINFPKEKYLFKTNILRIVNTFPSFGKIIFYISRKAWDLGLIQN
jgi:glycosyltransferase involved in cell wall biosynthesis